MIDKNEVKKELYKSKANAKFSHYVSGNLYYTVELSDGIYQFPISTIDIGKISEMIETDLYVGVKNGGYLGIDDKKIYDKKIVEDKEVFEEILITKLSSDLGTTSFYAEVKGSELNRWITKAIDKGDFIKVN